MRNLSLKTLLAAAAMLPLALSAQNRANTPAPDSPAAPVTSPATLPAPAPVTATPAPAPAAPEPADSANDSPAPAPDSAIAPAPDSVSPPAPRPRRSGFRRPGAPGAFEFDRTPPPAAEERPLDPNEIVGPIVFTDESLNQVISLYEKLTGKMVIRPLLPGVRINFNGSEKLTRKQAIDALQHLLAVNAVTLTPIAGSNDLVKAAYLLPVPWDIPPILTTPEEVAQLPDTYTKASRLYTFKHATAIILHPLLLPHVDPTRGESVTVFPTANAVLISTNAINIKRIEKILATLDTPSPVLFYKPQHVRASDVKKFFTNLYFGANPVRNVLGGDFTIEADDLANQVMVVTTPQNREKIKEIIEQMDKNSVELMYFKVQHIKASDVKKLIQSLQTGQSTTGAARPATPAAPGAVTQDAFRNVLGGDFIIEADDLANHLMVVAQPQVKEKIRKVIEQMDKNSLPKTTSEVIGLKHSNVGNVFKILQSIVTGATGTTGASATAARTTGSTAANRNASLTGSSGGGANLRYNDYETQSFTNRKTNTQSAPGTFTWGPGGPVPATIATPGTPNSFSEYVTVSSDDRTNRLMVFGTDDDIKQIKEIIAKIDVPLPQVRIEAIIVEVTLKNGESSGLDTLGLGYKSVAGVGTISNPQYNFNGRMPAVPGTDAPPLAISGSLSDFSLSVVFGIAAQNSRVRILASPLISAQHNQEAQIIIGQNYPYAGGTTMNNTTTQTNTEFADISLDLRVLPRISSTGTVEMIVSQSNKSLVGLSNIGGNPTPIVAQRTASSTLIAKNNETIVLAGLQSYQETESKGIMWFLGYIPLLGELFKPETNETTRTEIIVFLRPHVIAPEESNANDTTPGLTPGSLTRIDAKSYIDTGRFSAVSLTEDEREAIEEIRRRQNEQAAATSSEQLRNEQTDKQPATTDKP